MQKINAAELRRIIAEEARRFVTGEIEQMPEFDYVNINRLANGQRPLLKDIGTIPVKKEEKYKEVSQDKTKKDKLQSFIL
jgi:hypothetical protein